MNIETMKADLALKQKQIDDIKATALKQYKELFQEASKCLFDSFPELESFRWTQYTPYFNDGDECVFRAHTGYPYLNGSEDEYGWGKNKTPMGEAVREFLASFPAETLKEMFGDHCEITVARKSNDRIKELEEELARLRQEAGTPEVKTSSYEHD